MAIVNLWNQAQTLPVLAALQKKQIDAQVARLVGSGWYGKPIGEFSYANSPGSDWVTALGTATIGKIDSSMWHTLSDIPYYATPVGQNGAKSYGWDALGNSVLMSPQVFFGAATSSPTPIGSKTFKDVAVPLYGQNGDILGYAVSTAFIQPTTRKDDPGGLWDITLTYSLDYNKDKLLQNSVYATLPGMGEVLLFKNAEGFNSVFGADPEPKFVSDIKKPSPTSMFSFALSAVTALGGGGFFSDMLPGLDTIVQSAFGTAAEAATNQAVKTIVNTASQGFIENLVTTAINNIDIGSVISNAAMNVVTGALSGSDTPLQDALSGALTGAVTSSGILSGVSNGLIDLTGATGNAATAINSGVNAAARSGISTAVHGGDVGDVLQNAAIAGLASGVGSYVGNEVREGLNGVPVAPVEDATITPVDPAGWTEYSPTTGLLDSPNITLPPFSSTPTTQAPAPVVDANPIPVDPATQTPYSPTTGLLDAPGTIVPPTPTDAQVADAFDRAGTPGYDNYGNPIVSTDTPLNGTSNDTSGGLTNTLAGAAGGAAAGGTAAALGGGNIVNGLLTGGISGAAGGLASDLGASPTVAGATGAAAGGIVNTVLQPDPITSDPQQTTTPTPTPTPAPVNDDLLWNDGFSTFINVRGEWGSRLNAGRAR